MSAPSSALGFLTGTTTPVSSQVGNQGQVSTQLPDWYTNYTQTILNNALQFAQQPYPIYQGPRIAAQSPLTQSAYTGAAGLIPQAGAASQTANNLLQQATSQQSPLGAASPNLGAAGALYSASTNPALSGSAAANPYFAAASNPAYNTVQNYLNPYSQDVAQNIATLGAQNFNENILPSITNSFAAAGNITGGNTQEANLVQQAARNEQQAVSQAQAGALQTGYNSALSAAQGQNQINAGLGTAAGALANSGIGALQSAASGLGGLGTAAGNLQATGNQLGLTGAADASLIGSQNLNNTTNALNATNALGQQSQAYGQSNLNLAYQDFLNQFYYPMQQVGALQSALNGVQVPTAYNTNTLQTNYGQAVSPLQQVIGALQGYNSTTAPGGALTSLTTPQNAPGTPAQNQISPYNSQVSLPTVQPAP